MTRLEFNFDWEDPQGAKCPELRATWARLSIHVDSRNITELNDHKVKSVRRNVYLPLYPLAEWIAMHWWHLFHESPTADRRPSYDHRHNLRYAREGFALPDLEIRPMGRRMQLIWKVTDLRNCNLRFIHSGNDLQRAESVRDCFTNLIESVIERLEDQGIRETALHNEWAAITRASQEESDFCKVAAALGLNPYDISEDGQALILQAHDILPQGLSIDFFGAADFSRIIAQAQELKQELDAIESSTLILPNIKKAKDEYATDLKRKASTSPSPWQEGYTLAKDLREALGFQRMILRSKRDLFSALERKGNLDDAIRHSDSNKLFDAVVATNRSGSPGFSIDKSKTGEGSIKFSFCRALCEYIYLDNGTGSIVTRADTERQKRNRAFAAEFLAPVEMLRDRLSSRVVGEDKVEELAYEFSVSPLVVKHQLENKGFQIKSPW